MRPYSLRFSLCIIPLLLLVGCGSGSDLPETDTAPTIAVIPKGTMHEYWKSVHTGALQAAKEHGVDIIWKGPLKEDDREEQIQLVETFIAAKVDAVVLAPLDDRALMMPVREAGKAGIPTVIIDSALSGNGHVSFVATDNYKGGCMAAELVGELLAGKGKCIVLRYQEGSASNTKREDGFIATIANQFPGITMLSDNQYAGVTTESAYRASENILNRFHDVDAVFAPNEAVTFGVLRALQERGLAGKVILVGFDSSERLVNALESNELHGLVLQDPVKIGYLGVASAAAHLRGENIEKRIDTGVVIVTRNNMHNPEIEKLLHPE